MNALRPRSLMAICRRQLAGFLSNPVGYIVILVFVVATAALLVFRDEFFDRNLADLAMLHGLMPGVLAILLPLLAMSAWSSERESGTEELLLTMPISLADAVLGKYLAVVAFYTVALACCGANVVILEFLGSPDYGLVFTDYLAWWALGAVYAAFALLASILVASQVIAFVLGVLFCGVLWSLAWLLDWSYDFHRGLLDFGALFQALAAAMVGVSLSLLVLAARRWREGLMGHVWTQLGAVVLAVVLCINVGRIFELPVVERWTSPDLSVDQVSSLSGESLEIVRDLTKPVKLTVVVSAETSLPLHLKDTAQTILDRARALERESGGKVRLKILRPEDPADDDGRRAEKDFGLTSQTALKDSVIGEREVGIFMGAMVACGRHKQSIPFFDVGLSVEFELVRAIRSVARQAAEPEAVAITLTLAVPTAPPAHLVKPVADARKKAETLAKDPDVELVLLEVAGPDDAKAKQAEEAGIEIRTVKAGAVETPAEKAGEDKAGEDKAGEDKAGEDKADGEGGDAPATPPKPAEVEVCFGAVATRGDYTRKKAWLGDAYDVADDLDALVTGLKTSLEQRVPVLGVLKTDLMIHQHHDFMSRQPVDQALFLDEMAKHYEIREVEPMALNEEDNQDVDVLLAALPSSLLQEEMEELATYIWKGRPVLLLEDPCPIFPCFSQPPRRVAPRAPKLDPFQQPNQPPRQDLPPKGDLTPLFRMLGIELPTDRVAWCNYSPTASLQNQLGRNLIWLQRSQGSISDEHPVTRGIGSVLTVFPGVIQPRQDRDMTVTPLLWINKKEHGWGVNPVEDFLFFLPGGGSPTPYDGMYKYGGFNPEDQVTYTTDPSLREAYQAVEITGHPRNPYQGGRRDDDKEARVIVVADTDLMHDQFYNFYVNRSGRALTRKRQESGANADFEVISSLRNVQFLSNCIDYLARDEELVAIRGALADRRQLDRIDRQIVQFRKSHDDRIAAARKQLKQKVADKEADLTDKLEAIRTRGKQEGKDLQTIKNEQEIAEKVARKELETEILKLERETDKDVRDAERDLERSVAGLRWTVRSFALGIPSLLLLIVIVVVYLNKLVRERTDIPTSRKRSL